MVVVLAYLSAVAAFSRGAIHRLHAIRASDADVAAATYGSEWAAATIAAAHASIFTPPASWGDPARVVPPPNTNEAAFVVYEGVLTAGDAACTPPDGWRTRADAAGAAHGHAGAAATGGGRRPTLARGAGGQGAAAAGGDGVVLLATHLSADRGHQLQLATHAWRGCVSAAVLVRDVYAWAAVEEMWATDDVLRRFLSLHVVMPVGGVPGAGGLYPFNVLRNAAMAPWNRGGDAMRTRYAPRNWRTRARRRASGGGAGAFAADGEASDVNGSNASLGDGRKAPGSGGGAHDDDGAHETRLPPSARTWIFVLDVDAVPSAPMAVFRQRLLRGASRFPAPLFRRTPATQFDRGPWDTDTDAGDGEDGEDGDGLSDVGTKFGSGRRMDASSDGSRVEAGGRRGGDDGGGVRPAPVDVDRVIFAAPVFEPNPRGADPRAVMADFLRLRRLQAWAMAGAAPPSGSGGAMLAGADGGASSAGADAKNASASDAEASRVREQTDAWDVKTWLARAVGARDVIIAHADVSSRENEGSLQTAHWLRTGLGPTGEDARSGHAATPVAYTSPFEPYFLAAAPFPWFDDAQIGRGCDKSIWHAEHCASGERVIAVLPDVFLLARTDLDRYRTDGTRIAWRMPNQMRFQRLRALYEERGVYCGEHWAPRCWVHTELSPGVLPAITSIMDVNL